VNRGQAPQGPRPYHSMARPPACFTSISCECDSAH
jgi:hypothetical protein